MNPLFLWIAVGVLGFSSAGMLISRNWRWNLGLLAIQYLGAFFLALEHWQLNMASTLLVAGWMSTTALAMTQLNMKEDPFWETSWPQGRLFRIFSALLVLLIMPAATENLAAWIPASSPPLIWGALILISQGLLHLGMTLQPQRVILGLLSIILGFEIIFTIIENSILVAGLLVLVTLGLSFTGCYLLILGEQTT